MVYHLYKDLILNPRISIPFLSTGRLIKVVFWIPVGQLTERDFFHKIRKFRANLILLIFVFYFKRHFCCNALGMNGTNHLELSLAFYLWGGSESDELLEQSLNVKFLGVCLTSRTLDSTTAVLVGLETRNGPCLTTSIKEWTGTGSLKWDCTWWNEAIDCNIILII